MQNSTKEITQTDLDTDQPGLRQSLPNDSGQLEIMDFVRISDPSTNETLVEQRS